MNDPRRPPAAFHASLRDRLRQVAARTGRSHNELMEEFVLQRFLARVFAGDGPWVLKGGTSLLVRLPGARHSRDLDLLHPEKSLQAAIDELAALARQDAGDPFTFAVGAPVPMTGPVAGAQVKVEAYLGARRVARFPVDVSTDLTFVSRLEWQRPRPVVELPDVAPLPPIALYPLPDQVADKVCAMYELYGHSAQPSSRYRDLVDLVLIISNLELDATSTAAALTAEAHRRSLQLPTELAAPSLTWSSGYLAAAARTSLPKELHQLPAALAIAGACLNPLLAGELDSGTWTPNRQRWQ